MDVWNHKIEKTGICDSNPHGYWNRACRSEITAWTLSRGRYRAASINPAASQVPSVSRSVVHSFSQSVGRSGFTLHSALAPHEPQSSGPAELSFSFYRFRSQCKSVFDLNLWRKWRWNWWVIDFVLNEWCLMLFRIYARSFVVFFFLP